MAIIRITFNGEHVEGASEHSLAALAQEWQDMQTELSHGAKDFIIMSFLTREIDEEPIQKMVLKAAAWFWSTVASEADRANAGGNSTRLQMTITEHAQVGEDTAYRVQVGLNYNA